MQFVFAFFFSSTDLHRFAMSFYDIETKLAAFGIKTYDWWMSQGVMAEGGVDVLKGVVFFVRKKWREKQFT